MHKTWVLTIAALALMAALAYAAFLYLAPPALPEGVLYGNGHVEGIEVRVGAEVSGRVIESTLVEGQKVAAGETILRVEDSEMRIQLTQARAELKAVARERTGVEKTLRTWRHHLMTAESDLNRNRKLVEDGVVSRQRLDTSENTYEEARGRVSSLEAELEEIEARTEAARQRVELLKVQISKTEIHAPMNGTILVRGVEVGEYVSPGRVVAVLVDMSELELRIFIPEQDIGKVKLGDPARIRVNSFPDRFFEATVKRVDQQAQFTPKDIHVPEERTRMVFGVTLGFYNPEGYLKPGMPADSWIRWQPDMEWPEELPVPF